MVVVAMAFNECPCVGAIKRRRMRAGEMKGGCHDESRATKVEERLPELKKLKKDEGR